LHPLGIPGGIHKGQQSRQSLARGGNGETDYSGQALKEGGRVSKVSRLTKSLIIQSANVPFYRLFPICEWFYMDLKISDAQICPYLHFFGSIGIISHIKKNNRSMSLYLHHQKSPKCLFYKGFRWLDLISVNFPLKIILKIFKNIFMPFLPL
jgi:hypothetical protein